jgi:hypothetical protein
MADLTYNELEERLAAACSERGWQPPTRGRLKKLRDSEQLPKAIATYEKGRRGTIWRYDPTTVDAYLRCEEHRLATGSRVRSWKHVERAEQHRVILDWLKNPETPIPRETIAEELESFASRFQSIAAAAYSFVENPVGAYDDDRLEGAHIAIESMLEGSQLRGEWRSAADGLLQVLVFRDDEAVEFTDLPELIEPLRKRMGPFSSLFSASSIREAFVNLPVNELVTRPRDLLASVTDDELRQSAQVTLGMFNAIGRLAEVAQVVLLIADAAQKNEETRGDLRIDWFRVIAEGAKAVGKILKSDIAPSILSGAAIVNVWMLRNQPDSRANAHSVTSTFDTFTRTVEESKPAVERITGKALQ